MQQHGAMLAWAAEPAYRVPTGRRAKHQCLQLGADRSFNRQRLQPLSSHAACSLRPPTCVQIARVDDDFFFSLAELQVPSPAVKRSSFAGC